MWKWEQRAKSFFKTSELIHWFTFKPVSLKEGDTVFDIIEIEVVMPNEWNNENEIEMWMNEWMYEWMENGNVTIEEVKHFYN